MTGLGPTPPDRPAPLDPDELALLGAYRTGTDPEPDRLEALWRDIEQSVGRDADVPLRRPRRLAPVAGWALGVAAVAVLGLAIGAVWRAAATRIDRPATHGELASRMASPDGTGAQVSSRTRAPARDDVGDGSKGTDPSPAVPAGVDPTADPGSAPGTTVRPATSHRDRQRTERAGTEHAPNRPTPAAADPDRPPPPVQRPGGRQVGGETRLLQDARTSLARGRLEEALHRLDDHARQYPQGLMVEEREALRAIARCDRGDPGDHGTAFARRFPRSPLRDRVRDACR